MKMFAAAAASLLLLAGCLSPYGNEVARQPANLTPRQVTQVKGSVTYSMKDPSSAMFRNIRGQRITYDSGRVFLSVCGEVNGRNSYGGYVGFQPFHGDFDESGKFTLRNVDGYKNSMSSWACNS